MSDASNIEETIRSPCIAVCELDRADICRGCFRSKLEITDWQLYNNEQKMQVLKNAYRRALEQNPQDKY